MRIFFVIDCVGPYHVARLREINRYFSVVCVEVRSKSLIYNWRVAGNLGFVKDVLDKMYPRLPIFLATSLYFLRNAHDVDVIVTSGWSTPADLTAIFIGVLLNKKIIVMSDSAMGDKTRNYIFESIKRSILQNVDGAFVAGIRHRDYLKSLGIPSDRIERNYDVVDNAHFAVTRAFDTTGFLAVGRLVKKKNYFFMLDCYAEYCRRCMACDDVPWPLTIAGYGPLRHELEAYARSVGACVQFAGSKSYEDLPGLYATHAVLLHCSSIEQWGLVVNEAMAAGMPVIVSKNCGCVPELILQGQNGFALPLGEFNPWIDVMLMISSSPELRVKMGETSAKHIVNFDLSSHAISAKRLIEKVTGGPLGRKRKIGCLFIVLIMAIIRSFRRGE